MLICPFHAAAMISNGSLESASPHNGYDWFSDSPHLRYVSANSESVRIDDWQLTVVLTALVCVAPNG